MRALSVTGDRGFRDAGGQDLPHYAGHRERLREKFKISGGTALADYELLELALFRSIPRRFPVSARRTNNRCWST